MGLLEGRLIVEPPPDNWRESLRDVLLHSERPQLLPICPSTRTAYLKLLCQEGTHLQAANFYLVDMTAKQLQLALQWLGKSRSLKALFLLHSDLPAAEDPGFRLHHWEAFLNACASHPSLCLLDLCGCPLSLDLSPVHNASGSLRKLRVRWDGKPGDGATQHHICFPGATKLTDLTWYNVPSLAPSYASVSSLTHGFTHAPWLRRLDLHASSDESNMGPLLDGLASAILSLTWLSHLSFRSVDMSKKGPTMVRIIAGARSLHILLIARCFMLEHDCLLLCQAVGQKHSVERLQLLPALRDDAPRATLVLSQEMASLLMCNPNIRFFQPSLRIADEQIRERIDAWLTVNWQRAEEKFASCRGAMVWFAGMAKHGPIRRTSAFLRPLDRYVIRHHLLPAICATWREDGWLEGGE